MPRKALKKNSTPKKGGKANKSSTGGTTTQNGAAQRADSPTVSGLAGDDDAVIEQILEKSGNYKRAGQEDIVYGGFSTKDIAVTRGKTVRGLQRRRRFLEGAWHVNNAGQRSARVVTRAT